MKAWVGKTLNFAALAALVYACAGKSISRGDDDPVIDDDGYGNGGFSNAGYGGKGGGISSGGGPRGGTSGRGGSVGTGGFPGKGGTAGTVGIGGTTGIGGTNIGGEPGTAGEAGCGGRNVGQIFGLCTPQSTCISALNPAREHVRRNQVNGSGQAGEGGQGGDSGGGSDDMATANLCSSTIEYQQALLAFEYYAPNLPGAPPPVTLATGIAGCRGAVLGYVPFTDYSAPPRGVWSQQCIIVDSDELELTVSLRPAIPDSGVRNLRFVTSCACPRQVTRYTTCGDLTSQDYCN